MQLDHIDSGNAFDWGKASDDYAKYRDIYPNAFYDKIAALGLCVDGQDALDLGTGTGVLPRNMHRYGARWTGTDISPEQIEQAKRLAAESGMDIRFVAAPAEHTGLADRSFDVITACMCFFYFDKAKVVPEIARMLRPGGRFVILSMVWLPHESAIAAESERIVLRHNPAWTGGGFTRPELDIPAWSEELFTCEDRIQYDLALPFTRKGWHGRMRACRGVAATLSGEQLAAFDREHAEMLAAQTQESFEIAHHVSMQVFRVRG